MNECQGSRYLGLEERDCAEVLELTLREMLRYLADVDSLPVESIPSESELRKSLESFDFEAPMNPHRTINLVIDAMRGMQTHTSSTRYFGLFNPQSTTMGIVGEALAAAFNPQLAAWSHAPFAVEVEQHLIRSIGSRFDAAFKFGTFTSGGAEANTTALMSALVSRFPSYAANGLRSLARTPLIYASAASHHSLEKAVRLLGLGSHSLRVVPCDESLGMDTLRLKKMIDDDRAAVGEPAAIVATAGATATGIVERILDVAQIARANDMWLHVDAAWGGFAAIVPELAPLLRGIEFADSVTFDPHKALSIPMGVGLFLTRHDKILSRAFSITADYMPSNGGLERHDPFTHSMQWSRRFLGLKVLLSLTVAGWSGYRAALWKQTHLGDVLRSRLPAQGWRVVNSTPLPVVCFLPTTRNETPSSIVAHVVERGRIWISSAVLPNATPVLRACITNFRTSESDVMCLLAELGTG